jgi:cell wall-associated NlpC family hydrolase
MRTVSRRGLLAGAVTVVTSLVGSPSVFANEPDPGLFVPADSSDDGSVRTRAISTAQFTEGDTGLAVEARVEDAQFNTEQQQITGQAIADFALSWVGYPYVAGGNSPYGFDCSGFTQYVFLNMLGIDIGHGVENQPWSGIWVDWGNWIPGDLIVFQNTYKEGISHVGIYIGEGQIVHAENEGTGVTISSIYSDYYAAHYWGAARLV